MSAIKTRRFWQGMRPDEIIWTVRTGEWILAGVLVLVLRVTFRSDVWILIGSYAILSALFVWKKPARYLEIFNKAMILLDILLISGLVGITGQINSQAFMLYGIEMVFVATYGRSYWAPGAVAAILVSYGVSTGGWQDPQFWWREVVFIFLGLSVNWLGMAMREAMRNSTKNQIRLDQLAALRAVQESLVSLMDLQSAVTIIIQAGMDLLNADVGYAARMTPAGTLQMLAQVGTTETAEWDPGDSYEATVMTHRKIEFWDGARLREPLKVSHGLHLNGLQELALAPLSDGAGTIGALAFMRQRNGKPLHEQTVALEGLADMVVSQVRFATAQSEASKRGGLLAVLERVGRIVNRNLEMNSLLRSLHHAIADELEIDSFFVALALSDDMSRVQMQYLYDEGKEYPPNGLDIPQGSPTQRILQGESALLFNGEMGPSQLMGTYRMPRSAIFAPLLFEDCTLGVLSVQSYRVEYDTDHMEFVSSIAAQAAIAIRNAQLYEQTESVASTDYLTGLGNSRKFWPKLHSAIDYAHLMASPLALLLIDSDSLKLINDHYGHMAGDAHLQTLADVIRNSVRDEDTACRYAGDEFVIILPNTRLKEALAVGERIRRSMDGKFAWNKDSIIGATISVGAAEFQSLMSSEELFTAADRAMYEAKQSGKNRVVAI